MTEVFKNYEHYVTWLNANWERRRELDEMIINQRLVVELENNYYGESFRALRRNEFDKRSNENFIPIPLI